MLEAIVSLSLLGNADDGSLAIRIGSNVFETSGPCFSIEDVLSQSPKMRDRSH